MKFFIILLPLLAGCGQSSGNSVVSATPGSPGQTVVETLNARRSGANVDSNDTRSMPANAVAQTPQASDLSVIQNGSEFYHVTVTVGNVSCDFIHNAGAAGFVNGAGCGAVGASFPVTAGQLLTTSITTNITQNTIVSVDVRLTY